MLLFFVSRSALDPPLIRVTVLLFSRVCFCEDIRWYYSFWWRGSDTKNASLRFLSRKMMLLSALVAFVESFLLSKSAGASGTHFDAIESKAVSNAIKPVLTTQSQSQIGCFMKVNFKKNPCHIVEVKHISHRKWICKIFTTTDGFSKVNMVDEEKSTVYTDHHRAENCKKPLVTSCQDLYQSGTTSDGIYEIQVKWESVSVSCDLTTEGGG